MSAVEFLKQAIELALENVRRRGGRPFGAVLVRDGVVVATGVNEVLANHDPTAHAEMQAIRSAAAALGVSGLRGAAMFASGQPCPMCLAAMYLTGIEQVHYAYSNEDGAPYGLSTAPIYAELARPPEQRTLQATYLRTRLAGEDLYEAWRASTNLPGR
jgi:tRNA(Arg) A34 adenosine deaminase TadA